MVSIVVPVYNVEKYIRHCVESIIGQTYKNIDIIIVDDGSTDNSGSICDEYAARYDNVRIFHKVNGGLSDARNYGMKYAKGKWLAFVDGDDILHRKFIEQLVELSQSNDLDIAICDFYCLQEKNINSIRDIACTSAALFWEGKCGTEELLYQKKFTTSAWGKLYKKELFHDIYFPFGKLHEDVGTIYKVFLRARKVGYIDRKLYYYLQREGSIVKTAFSLSRMDYIFFTKEIIEYFENKDQSLLLPAISRHFSACFQVGVLIPSKGFYEERKMIKEEIRKYRRRVLWDKKARIKNRMAALLSYSNIDFAIAVCRRFM